MNITYVLTYILINTCINTFDYITYDNNIHDNIITSSFI